MPQPEPAGQSEARFTRRVGLFSFGTLISRVLGLVRESVFAHLFGAGLATDAFNVAFRIPNFFRDLFAESALSAAFVPAFVQSLRRDDRDQTWRFAANVLNAVALSVGLVVIAGLLFTPVVVRVVALGFADEPAKLALTTLLTRVMFPFLLFVAFAAWAMGVLNACGTFFTPAVAPAAFNVVSIAVPLATYGLLRERGLDPILGMAAGVTLGSVAQFLVQVPRLLRHGFRWRPVLDLRQPGLRRVFTRWLPMMLGYATWQVNFLVNTFLLTFLAEGSVTWVSYAYRIQHLPAGLFGAAIGSVALAEYSHEAAGDSPTAIGERFRHAMGLVAALTIPAAVLLFVLAGPVVQLIYQHGRFTALDAHLTTQALMLYCLGIWSAAATRNCAAGFYSLGDTRTPALVAVGVVAANVVLNLILMRFIEFRSFPLATSLVQAAYFVLLFLLLRRRVGNLHGRHIAGVSLRTLLAAAGAGLAAWLASRALSRLPLPGFWLHFARVACGGAVGLALFYLLARLLRVKEVQLAVRAVLDRFRGHGR
ncbi:murein biosynthesis integral membrane protein MurJ [candidate division WOR-3 bacterium]|nr:murein biosynthesis integral membrane protein MurJ [candidate division WOR-3 bacterium]